jgi:thioredoxin reductase (NADPH)
MFDWDVVIIGGGPAGLTAGLYLSRGKRSTILLEKEIFGGPIMNYESVENYPGFSDGVPGAQLGSEMVKQATKYGLKLEQAEVEGIELFSNGRYVRCASGTGYMTTVVIIAGGSHHKKLGAPGEEKLQRQGVFNCAFCDGGKYADGIVAVCGGGDSGITEALYLTRIASKVIVLEAMPALTASAVLQERASANPKLEIRCGTKVKAIIGDSQVEGIELINEGGQGENIKVDGVLVQVGQEPNTGYLKDIVTLDSGGRIIVNERMETEVPCILAAGDIRSGSPNQIITAAGDGATAAISAERLLQKLV